MERTRSTRSAASAVAASPITKKKKDMAKVVASSETQVASPSGRTRRGAKKTEEERPESPFFGFNNTDIPQPIIIKTEDVDPDTDDCFVIEVCKAAKPPGPMIIKKEKIDDDDIDTFHGFSLDDLPRPIVIKEEPTEDISAERAENTVPDMVSQIIQSPTGDTGPQSGIPGDDLDDEFESDDVDAENNTTPRDTSEVKIKKLVNSPTKPGPVSPDKLKSPVVNSSGSKVQFIQVPSQEHQEQSHKKFVVSQEEKPVVVQQPKFIVKPSTKNIASAKIQEQVIATEAKSAITNKIQIIDQNGEKIELITQEGEFETDGDDTEDEDHEFTVIVEDNDQGEVTNISGDIQMNGENVIEGDSIEDIIAQFENESSPGTTAQSVSCPTCRKCFVSKHFLKLHMSNSATVCDSCNKQCCSQVALRNHKNLDCALAKRKRNIDLIAKETALLGRKPIEPEKYYNQPIGGDDDDDDIDDDQDYPGSPPAKKLKSINDAKYECSICGKYVKILDSHMKFSHGQDEARGDKTRCPECGVLVSDLETHVARRHGDHADKIVIEDDLGEVVRCRHPGCDLFFNNGDEVAEHIKGEHLDEMKLPCGMGGCDEVFDNRGALKRHRTDAHPELEEFKPVDLEPDDPDVVGGMTVACPVCEKKFKHKNTCTVHIKTHHLGWSKRKLFECPDCFRAFDNKKAVEAHREAVHLGIRTVCPLCEKPVTRLDLHVRMVHTELPEWPCPGKY